MLKSGMSLLTKLQVREDTVIKEWEFEEADAQRKETNQCAPN